MAERIVATAKAPESKQKCSNFCKLKRDYDSSGSCARVLQLQRTTGNQAAQKLIKSRTLQAKLRVSQPDDIYEQEADQIAEYVMREPDPVLQREYPTYEDEKKVIQAKASSGKLSAAQDQSLPSLIHEVLQSPGQPLDPITRAFMEPRFGHDFSRVRVHSGETAEQSARDVNAHAYTVGHNIVFGMGQFAPEKPEGRRLIAHELAHVIQQSTAPAPSVVQRQAGGDASTGGTAARTAPAGRAPTFSVKYNGCGKAPYSQTVVEAAAREAYNRVVNSNCIRSQELRNEILSEFANLEIDCEQGSYGNNCGMAFRFFSHTVNLYPRIMTDPGCSPMASIILHEVVHLTELRLLEHGDLADACETSCFPFELPSPRGDPAKCSEKTLVLHGPRFAFGTFSGSGGSSALGRFGYEVIRSWTGTAFSLGLRLDVPLRDRESFVRAGLEVGTNFQLLGSLYGRLFGGLAIPLPPGVAPPSMFAGAGLGLNFGRAQLEVLYDVLDPLSREERTHQLMLGMGFKFGK